jgi:hypothetical protein
VEALERFLVCFGSIAIASQLAFFRAPLGVANI